MKKNGDSLSKKEWWQHASDSKDFVMEKRTGNIDEIEESVQKDSLKIWLTCDWLYFLI